MLLCVPPKRPSTDLIAARASDLSNVPAALFGRAVVLHQIDGHVLAATGFSAGIDQTPEDVAVVGVGARTFNTLGNAIQRRGDLAKLRGGRAGLRGALPQGVGDGSRGNNSSNCAAS